MNNDYIPDTWVVLEIKSEDEEPIRKLFGGWYGGYTSGDEWRLNSGITETVDNGDHYEFHGYSGSVYKCYKNNQKMSSYQMSILNNIRKQAAGSGVTIEVIEYV